MSEEQSYKGPTMLVATDALRSPELRIGTIGQSFTLPRTVRAVSLFAGGAGAVAGMVLLPIFVGMTLSTLMYGAILGGACGIGVISYSPLRGESLGKWLGLKIKSSRRKTIRNGKPVRLAIGICYIEPKLYGKIRIKPGAVNVRPGSVDQRYYPTELKTKKIRSSPRFGTSSLPADNVSNHHKSHTGNNPSLTKFRTAQTALASDMRDPKPESNNTYKDSPSAYRNRKKWSQNSSDLKSLYDNYSEQ